MNLKYTIRKGVLEDMPQVLDLIKELALFEKAPEEVTNTVEAMQIEYSSPDSVFHLLVAIVEEKIVGIAIYFRKYSTWKGTGVYLDDIVVTEKMRGQGIGKALFERFIVESKKMNAKQVHWQVLDWNSPAIEFYKKYDASMDNEWINCKLSEEQL